MMKNLWEQQWFIKTISFLRKWKWFDTYIYGKSVNLEDFVRNPAEVLRDNCFPFVFKNVKPKSLLMLRLGYIPYSPSRILEYFRDISEYLGFNPPPEVAGTYHKVYVGNKGWTFTIKDKQYDILFWNDWCTKYPNAVFMFQIAISLKKYIPIPYISMNIHYKKDKYFQLGGGWGPQRRGYLDPNNNGKDIIWDASLSGKFRFASFTDELRWNPGAEVFGYWEGTI